MRCPTCGQNSPETWKVLKVDFGGGTASYRDDIRGPGADRYKVDWMQCANQDCREIVIRVHKTGIRITGGQEPVGVVTSLVVWPPGGAARRVVDPIVPPPMRDDLNEAASILDLSPRMSAVLARSILADLLAEFAGHKEFGLETQIDSFNKNTSHPRALRENLHRFRETANLGAHTTTSDQGAVIRVEREEAEWTLDLVARLFDYLIVTPASDKKMRDAIDEKIRAANRKPIKPLPDDPTG